MRQRRARLAYDHAQLSLAHVTATIIIYPLGLILSLRSARPHPSSHADGDDQLYIVITPPPDYESRREHPPFSNLRFKSGHPASNIPKHRLRVSSARSRNNIKIKIYMSSQAGSTSNKPASKGASPRKGKGKQEPVASEDAPMDVEQKDDDDDDEDEEDSDEEMERDEESDEDEEEDMNEIDPTVIQTRRTRGIRVDYTSAEALAKAGLEPTELELDEDDE